MGVQVDQPRQQRRAGQVERAGPVRGLDVRAGGGDAVRPSTTTLQPLCRSSPSNTAAGRIRRELRAGLFRRSDLKKTVTRQRSCESTPADNRSARRKREGNRVLHDAAQRMNVTDELAGQHALTDVNARLEYAIRFGIDETIRRFRFQNALTAGRFDLQ